MLKLFFVFVILLMILPATYSQSFKPATESEIKEIKDHIQKVAIQTNSLQCKFVQKKSLSVLSETVTSEGVLYFKKENKLRWQYNKPYSYIFVLNSGKVMIKNDSRTDRFDTDSNKMFKEISEIMIGGVRGNLLVDNKKFSAQYMVGTSVVVVKLTPQSKDLKQLMTAINLTFSKSDWLVQSIEMLETGGDNTIITFTDKNVNKTISDDLFRVD